LSWNIDALGHGMGAEMNDILAIRMIVAITVVPVMAGRMVMIMAGRLLMVLTIRSMGMFDPVDMGQGIMPCRQCHHAEQRQNADKREDTLPQIERWSRAG
jgi:hypothetical protein